MPTHEQTPTTTIHTKESLWASQLDPEQMAARLVALAADLKALPITQRQALWIEAAKRLYDGTPTWQPTTLPTQKELDAANSVTLLAADAPAPAGGDEEAPTERGPRKRKTGHPPTDRAIQAAKEGAA